MTHDFAFNFFFKKKKLSLRVLKSRLQIKVKTSFIIINRSISNILLFARRIKT